MALVLRRNLRPREPEGQLAWICPEWAVPYGWMYGVIGWNLNEYLPPKYVEQVSDWRIRGQGKNSHKVDDRGRVNQKGTRIYSDRAAVVLLNPCDEVDEEVQVWRTKLINLYIPPVEVDSFNRALPGRTIL